MDGRLASCVLSCPAGLGGRVVDVGIVGFTRGEERRGEDRRKSLLLMDEKER